MNIKYFDNRDQLLMGLPMLFMLMMVIRPDPSAAHVVIRYIDTDWKVCEALVPEDRIIHCNFE